MLRAVWVVVLVVGGLYQLALLLGFVAEWVARPHWIRNAILLLFYIAVADWIVYRLFGPHP